MPNTGTYDDSQGLAASSILDTVCRSRVADTRFFNEGFAPVGSCDRSNPRVLSALMLDPPECICRPCAAGNASIGGEPEHAVCYDAGASPQRFSVVFGIQVIDEGRRRLGSEQQDARVLNVNAARHGTMLEVQAGRFVTTYLETVAAQQLFGATVGLQSLSVQGRAVPGQLIDADSANYVRYYANVSFIGSAVSRQALVAAINAASSCDDLAPVPVGDGVLSFCASFAATLGTPGGDLAEFAELAHIRAYEIPQPAVEGLSSNVGFAPAALNALFLILTRVFAGTGKFLDQRNKVRAHFKAREVLHRAMTTCV